jgi:hypothetical protein
MAAALWLAQRALFAAPLHGIARIAALSALVAIGMAAYGLAVLVFGATDVRGLVRMIRRRTAQRYG